MMKTHAYAESMQREMIDQLEKARPAYLVFVNVATSWMALPESQRLRIPMLPGNRSLNLSNAAAVVVFEAWRQQGFAGGD